MIAPVQPTFVLIGAGQISRTYARAFSGNLPFRLTGVADIDKSSAEKIAAVTGASAWDDIESMCVELRPTAAIICTPPNTQAAIAIELMNLGIHVMCEKPLGVSTMETRRMIAAADHNDVQFTIASSYCFDNDIQTARQMILDGELGEVILFENTFARRIDMAGRWNSDPCISGGGVLRDRGPQSIDLVRYLLGPVMELQVMEGHRIQDLDVEDTVRLMVKNDAGSLGTIDLSWSISKDTPHFISIYGAAGTLQIGKKESRFQRAGEKNWTVFGDGFNRHAALTAQLKNFAASIPGVDHLEYTARDALASALTIEAAYHALESTSWQPVQQPEREWHRPGMGASLQDS